MLVVLACVSLVASVIGVWANRNLLDSDRFVTRVAPLSEDPAFELAMTNELTRVVMSALDPRSYLEEALPDRADVLAIPLTAAIDNFVHDRVGTFVTSDRFDVLFEAAARRAHEGAVRLLKDESDVVQRADGSITLDLVPVVQEILTRLGVSAPDLLGDDVELPAVSTRARAGPAIAALERALDRDLPADFGQITVYDEGRLSAAQQALRRFEQLVVALLALTVVCVAAALWLSRRRRRTLLQLLIGATIGIVVLRRVLFALGDGIAEAPARPVNQDAIRVVVDQFFDPLLAATVVMLAVVVGIAVLAVLSGPYPWTVSLRHRTASVGRSAAGMVSERAQDDDTLTWVAAHRDALQIGAACLALLLLWITDLSWLGVVVVLALLALVVVAVQRVQAPAAVTPDG